jgi:hypothetical protein
MTDSFRLLMISAMYENGGNTTHRFLDGHPQLFVYPFESQLGTGLVHDHLSSMFPAKYRWPSFALEADVAEDYGAFIDEEVRIRARTPQVSKFRHVDFDFSDEERGLIYSKHVKRMGRSRGANVAAFFRATFDAWHNLKRSGEETVFVGYSPIVVIDGEKIFSDFPDAHILHVVRNPWSAYADTKKRPVPLSLEHYMLAWTLNQRFALLHQERFPKQVHILRAEDIMATPQKALGSICSALGLEVDPALAAPSWNRTSLKEVFPWGTIRRATAEANRATATELSVAEREAVRAAAGPYLESFDYTSFLARAA